MLSKTHNAYFLSGLEAFEGTPEERLALFRCYGFRVVYYTTCVGLKEFCFNTVPKDSTSVWAVSLKSFSFNFPALKLANFFSSLL